MKDIPIESEKDTDPARTLLDKALKGIETAPRIAPGVVDQLEKATAQLHAATAISLYEIATAVRELGPKLDHMVGLIEDTVMPARPVQYATPGPDGPTIETIAKRMIEEYLGQSAQPKTMAQQEADLRAEELASRADNSEPLH